MPITFKDILAILDEQITAQREKLAASGSHLDVEKLDALTMAKYCLERFILLSSAH